MSHYVTLLSHRFSTPTHLSQNAINDGRLQLSIRISRAQGACPRSIWQDRSGMRCFFHPRGFLSFTCRCLQVPFMDYIVAADGKLVVCSFPSLSKYIPISAFYLPFSSFELPSILTIVNLNSDKRRIGLCPHDQAASRRCHFAHPLGAQYFIRTSARCRHSTQQYMGR
jgi:hypothetical protein